MIFKPVLVSKLLAGRKTQTRRVAKPYVPPASPYYVTKAGRRCRRPTPRTINIDGREHLAPYRVGQRVPVQKRYFEKAVAHIEITGLRTEIAGALSFDDARAEGFRSPPEFRAYWTRLHDKRWVANLERDIARWYGPPPAGAWVDDDIAVARFDEQHAATLVWVIDFQVCDAPEMFLAPARPGCRDYTTVEALSLTATDDTPGNVPHVDPVDGEARYRRDRPALSTLKAWQHAARSGEWEAMLSRLRISYQGVAADDVAAAESRYVTPGDVRKLRREMGLRGNDGLAPVADDQRDAVLAGLRFSGASAQTVAFVLDCSDGEAARLLGVPPPGWMQERHERPAA